ncbi:Uncharacterised protein [Mycolicibacterium aurum]|uniref:Uncharacterized protein n=1 Tax=Mycolicibacterium aurum TaxID=1791 RepID=A0A448IXP9_MYCAU|nr:Uncharacterised protein [Mycolicibacterium aurum]
MKQSRSGNRPGGVSYEHQPGLDPWTLRSLENNDASELSWGDGLVPPGYEDADPIDGGTYKGKTPRQLERVNISRGL